MMQLTTPTPSTKLTKPRLLVITGAGISKESNLPTFRDKGGLWKGVLDINKFGTRKGFEQHTGDVLRVFNDFRLRMLAAEPNAAHYAIAELERSYDVTIVTQNGDNLHERAGSTRVYHVHGKCDELRCQTDSSHTVPYDRDFTEHDLAPDGFPWRPNVVFFNESIHHQKEAEQALKEAQQAIVVGTSLEVYPVAAWVEYLVAKRHILTYNVNPEQHDGLSKFTRCVPIAEKATIGVPQVAAELIEMVQPGKLREQREPQCVEGSVGSEMRWITRLFHVLRRTRYRQDGRIDDGAFR